jgi:anti-sigma factor (TIGR02949 family)
MPSDPLPSTPPAPPDIDCLTAVRQLWDYLDAELSEERMAAIRRHLTGCERCLPHHDFARRFLDALSATREDQRMPPDVRARVMHLLADAGYRVG